MNLIVKDGIVITMDKERRIIEDGAVVIEGNKIVDVDKTHKIEEKYNISEYELIDASGMAVLPGFVNTHAHMYQNFMKGWHDDLPLKEWCDFVLFPVVKYAKTFEENGFNEFFYYSNMLAAIEAIRSGITTMLNFGAAKETTLRVFDEIGMRGIMGITLADKWIPEELIRPTDEVLRDVQSIIDKWHNSRNGRLKVMYAPSTPFICTQEFLQKIKEHSEKTGVPITIHTSETRYEVKLIKDETGMRPIEYLDKIGFLGKNVLAVHCVWVNDNEINLLAKHDVKVSHNPKSNMRLASGIAPIVKMRQKGITIGLATDGAASNDNLDMIETMRAAAFLAKVSTLRAGSLVGKDVLEMATIEGARAVFMENEIGSLEPGKKADVILIDLRKPHLQPVCNVINTIVYVASACDVNTVIIDGKIIMKDRKILTVDENRILETVKEKFEPALKEIYNQTLSMEKVVESEDIQIE